MGCSPWGHKQLDTLSDFTFTFLCRGYSSEQNGQQLRQQRTLPVQHLGQLLDVHSLSD